MSYHGTVLKHSSELQLTVLTITTYIRSPHSLHSGHITEGDKFPTPMAAGMYHEYLTKNNYFM